MKNPKFSLRSGMLGISLLAVWLASSQVQEYSSAVAMRSLIWFFLFAIAVLSAVNCSGKSRAFWVGVVFALFMKSPPNFLEPYAPKFYLSNLLADRIASPGPQWRFLYETLNLLMTLILCLVCGIISRSIYSSTRQMTANEDGQVSQPK